MTFSVRFSAAADADLVRLLTFLLDRADTVEDVELAQAAVDSIRAAAVEQLAVMPFSFRKAARDTTRRELVMAAGATGYVALYEIENPSSVVVLAVRHQREDDYH